MQVFCPADDHELVEMLPLVMQSGAPAYVRYNAAPAAVSHVAPFTIGKAEVFGDGTDVALLTFGFLLREVEKAREILAAAGLGVRLVNLRTLKPIDQRVVLAAARECKLVVTVEDHFRTGGLHSIVAETLLEHQTTCRTLPLALDQRWFKPGTLGAVLAYEGFTGDQIAAKVRAAIG
jgi:transketolase